MKKVLLGLLLISTVAQAEYTLKLGGSLNSCSLLDSKTIAVGLQNPLGSVFMYQLEGGYFSDLSKGYLLNTVYGNASLGTSLDFHWSYIKLFFGPALVSRTDEYLSTPYEFNTDFELGLKDEKNVGMGVGYKHMSNAGLQGPNLGRDFLYFKLQLP